jgi:hypothetical protein
MFQDLDLTLKNLFPPPAAPPAPFQLLRGADKSFLAPDKTFSPSLNTVNLFLYDVKENRELRDNTPIVEKHGATFVRKPPPVRVDCSYIVTAWSTGSADIRVATEHQLLAEALHWLTGFPAIPQSVLDKLAPTSPLQKPIYAIPVSVAQLDPNKNTGDFWIALGISPRSAFSLTVNVPMVLDLPVGGHLVTTRTARTDTADGTGGEDWVQIGGQVLDASVVAPNPLKPIPGALVEAVDAGLQAVSAADGRYTFPRVPTGRHTVRATATGFRILTTTVNVPDQPAGYDLLLTPLP